MKSTLSCYWNKINPPAVSSFKIFTAHHFHKVILPKLFLPVHSQSKWMFTRYYKTIEGKSMFSVCLICYKESHYPTQFISFLFWLFFFFFTFCGTVAWRLWEEHPHIFLIFSVFQGWRFQWTCGCVLQLLKMRDCDLCLQKTELHRDSSVLLVI